MRVRPFVRWRPDESAAVAVDSSGLHLSQKEESLAQLRGLIPEHVELALEHAVATALDEPDLRTATECASGYGIPDDQNDLDLLVLLVLLLAGEVLPKMWTESDTFSPFVAGFILAAVQAQDLAAGRDPAGRSLTPYQQEWLEKYRSQADHEAQ